MKITIRDIEDQKKEARIELEWDRVQADYEDILAEYMKLPVPGFRPGKAPKARVEKQFEKEILDDVGIRCTERFSRRALENEGITSTGPIAVTDLVVEYGKPLEFTAEFTELPDFDLPDYHGFVLTAQTDAEQRDEISVFLVDETTIYLPSELIRQELSFDGDTSSKPGDDAWNAAGLRVKLLLILDKIARQDGIEVDERDLEERIEQIASLHDSDPAAMKRMLLRNGGLSRLSRFLLAEKALDYLIDICGH